MKKLLLILFVCLNAFAVKAAHLVGGEISYVCTGNNNYVITMKIYRDCNSSGAQFDPQAKVAIYNSSGILERDLAVPLGPIIQLPTTVANPCLIVPPNICTEMATYTVTVNLPSKLGGYTITHQRCCRNQTITNIPNPGTWGNTYTTKIPSNDNCNSGPSFNFNPPIILCIGDSLYVNSSATDIDGDSLYYELCNPLDGGSQSTPAPPVPLAPPYTNVSFLPPYSSSNPLPGNPSIQIDPVTGFISGKPSQAGQYVFAICVTEYRNGVPLSTTMRDYQFNVTNCQSNVSVQISPNVSTCVGKTIQFNSQSINATNFLWDFGEVGILSDTSRAANPSHTFADTGTYKVKLIINPGWPCTDSAFLTVNVRYPITSKFKWSGDVCFDAQMLDFQPDANVSNKASYFWYFGNDANITQSSNEFPPPISFNAPGKYYVTLQIDDYGCRDIYGDTIEIFGRPEAEYYINSAEGCAPFTVTFRDSSFGGTVLKRLWDFGDGTTSTDVNPTHTYDNPGNYNINLLVFTEEGCVDSSTYNIPGGIIVNPTPVGAFSLNPQETSIYKPLVEVLMDSLQSGEISWLDMGDGMDYENRLLVRHEYQDTGTFTVKYVVINEFNCRDTVVKFVRIKPETNIFVPNAFTPDGDGLNEIFLPEITGAREYEFMVFSRWGEVIFQTNDLNLGWNGSKFNNGEILSPGVYTYVISVKDLNYEFHSRKGSIMLIR